MPLQGWQSVGFMQVISKNVWMNAHLDVQQRAGLGDVVDRLLTDSTIPERVRGQMSVLQEQDTVCD